MHYLPSAQFVVRVQIRRQVFTSKGFYNKMTRANIISPLAVEIFEKIRLQGHISHLLIEKWAF